MPNYSEFLNYKYFFLFLLLLPWFYFLTTFKMKSGIKIQGLRNSLYCYFASFPRLMAILGGRFFISVIVEFFFFFIFLSLFFKNQISEFGLSKLLILGLVMFLIIFTDLIKAINYKNFTFFNAISLLKKKMIVLAMVFFSFASSVYINIEKKVIMTEFLLLLLVIYNIFFFLRQYQLNITPNFLVKNNFILLRFMYFFLAVMLVFFNYAFPMISFEWLFILMFIALTFFYFITYCFQQIFFKNYLDSISLVLTFLITIKIFSFLWINSGLF